MNFKITFLIVMQHIRYAMYSFLMLSAFLLTVPIQAGEISQNLNQDTQQGDLVVHASGFLTESGQAVADIFLQGEDVLGKPHIRIVGSIKQGQAMFSFPHIKYGSYAIRVFHDENGNNKLDHNSFNFPAEPLGFSNGFRPGIFSGLPSFEKLRFTFGADTKPLEITVK